MNKRLSIYLCQERGISETLICKEPFLPQDHLQAIQHERDGERFDPVCRHRRLHQDEQQQDRQPAGRAAQRSVWQVRQVP